MTSYRLFLAGAVAALAAIPSTAHADNLVVPAAGAQNIAYAGGWTAWSAPAGDGRFELVVRAPDGTAITPDIATFATPPEPTIGSVNLGPAKRLLVAYSRCDGESAIAGCDVHSYDLRAGGAERPVDGLSSRTYSETAPALNEGVWSFVRRGGGPRKGVYVMTRKRPTRISPILARDTANNGTRVAYAYNSSRGGGLAIRRISQEGGVLVPASRLAAVPRSIQLTRYHAAWLVGDQVFSTTRFAGSGGPYAPTTVAGREIAGIDSVGVGYSTNQTRYIDRQGIRDGHSAVFQPQG